MRKIDRLYLVDDDSLFKFLTQRVIQDTDLVDKVEVFSNGLEAINHLNEIKETPAQLPDVILLDIDMPVMDGWGFLEEYGKLLPELDRKITTYIVSSSNDPADISRSKTFAEVKDFIIKPITKQKFIEMVKAL
ncbi:MAG: response regulator [Sphingobacteriales bacterium JAD_PAG50586_3]|nr:MAG: response regulator [Sphingobacteriales bacterium JAD_PAG50586_3]